MKSLTEIAQEINTYLHQFEADPNINIIHDGPHGWSDYYNARAHRSGRYVQIIYISYQTPNNLDRNQAEKYLAWLKAGNKGKHYKSFQKGDIA